jgi:hypothetical protein
MLHTTGRITITTDASGDATVYLGSKLRGYLVALFYRPGTLATGADLTVTAEDSGAPILTKANLGTANSYLYPRALPTNANSLTGPLGTVPSELIPLVNERIKVVVAQGGNTLTGSIEAVFETVED